MITISIGDIKIVAGITNLTLFITFSLVNLSLIVLRYKKPGLKRKFVSPLNIGRFNIIAFLGAIFSLFMIYYVIIGF